MTARVDVADCVAWAEAYDGPPFHALLCDPPYELGFMGRAWDRSGVAFNPDTWRALARVLHPGAFGMAFASSRGWHRLAVAIEDAGLRIHPSIFLWANGSGFPKATRIPDAPDFDGHRYGGQAMKPAAEPIIVFQKPYAGRPVDSITATGAGALNVDGGRVPTGAQDAAAMSGRSGGHASYGPDDTNVALGRGLGQPLGEIWQPASGRWPANLVVCHTPDCVRVGERRVATGMHVGRNRNGDETHGGYSGGFRKDTRDIGHADADGLETVAAYDCAPGCPVAALGAQSGELRAAAPYVRRVSAVGMYGPPQSPGEAKPAHDVAGTAARFYHNPDFALDIAERLAAAEPVRYVAKASRRERNAGCDDFAERAMNWSSGEQSPGTFQSDGTNRAARNPHPTVKPLALAQHLATLLLPPDAYAPRRLFVPFAGSGSECIGAMLAGWDEVVGVELSDEYADIARARLAWWEANRPAATQPQLPIGAAV